MRAVFLNLILCIGLLVLAGCEKKFIPYNGPEITKVEVFKERRLLRVLHKNTVVKTYEMELGFGATGHKQFEGDGKTPEGRYFIDRRNPNSSFYLSLGISYPNSRDIAFARAQGKSPGGDIFIHGQPNVVGPRGPDWTAGCIAVTNKEMRELYAMVKLGTIIDIFP
ncbi:MAG: L,D-transpeptidase family protein [Pseudomonadota bacterium]